MKKLTNITKNTKDNSKKIGNKDKKRDKVTKIEKENKKLKAEK